MRNGKRTPDLVRQIDKSASFMIEKKILRTSIAAAEFVEQTYQR
jgi:hypothetical protein